MSDQATMASGDEGKPSDSTMWRLPLSATGIFDLVFTRHGGGEPSHEVATKQTAEFTVGDWSSAGRGKLFEFLSRVHDQHEAKIAHYDDLRHKSLQFGVTAFGALFALALNMDKLAGAMAVAVVMTALTIILFLVDLYYHGLTHRAAFEKDYTRVKITELLNANRNDVFYFRAGYGGGEGDVMPYIGVCRVAPRAWLAPVHLENAACWD